MNLGENLALLAGWLALWMTEELTLRVILMKVMMIPAWTLTGRSRSIILQ